MMFNPNQLPSTAPPLDAAPSAPSTINDVPILIHRILRDTPDRSAADDTLTAAFTT